MGAGRHDRGMGELIRMKTIVQLHRVSSRRLRRGFTLIDLTLTLFIIGLFAAIAFPRYGQLVTKFRADAVAQQIAADLHFARQRAKLKGASQTVQFDAAANRYELIGLSDLDHPESPYLVELADSGPATDLVSVSFGTLGADTSVTFDLYGRPDSGGSVVIEVGGNQRTVFLDGTTGSVEVQP